MSLNTSSELEKKNNETEQTSADTSKVEKKEKKESSENTNQQTEVENQKDQSSDKTTSITEALLADLDKEVVSDVYTEKTKKEMLVLRTDISAGKIDAPAATKKLETLKKEKQSDTKENSTDDDLTLWQEAKKWALMTFLPAGIGKKIADKIKPEKKSDTEDTKEKESKWRWKALKWTGILTVGTLIATKAKNFFTKKLAKPDTEEKSKTKLANLAEGESNESTSQQNVDQASPDQTPPSAGESVENQNNDQSDQLVQQPTAEQIEQHYQSLQKEHPTFDESFLRAWSLALLTGQQTFQDNGKTYFCYKNENGDNTVTADSVKYETYVQQQEQSVDSELPTVQGEMSPEQQQQSDEATQEANDLHSQGFDELYILMRMYQRGFIPAKSFGEGRMLAPINAIFDKQFDAAVYMRKLIPGVRARLTLSQAIDLQNMADPDYYKRVDMLAKIEQDLKNGSTLKDIEKKYGKQLETERPRYSKRSKRALAKVQKNIDATIDKYAANEKQILELEKQMKESKNASLQKLQEIDAQATKTTDPKVKKQLLSELQKYTDEYNAKAVEYHKATGQIMSTMSPSDIMRVETKSPFVKGILKSSGGVTKFIEKVNTKGGKFALGIALWGLATRGLTTTSSQGLKEVAWDVADLGAGMVPFAGGAYDVVQAFRGKDLNGREMSMKDRWIRGSIGAVTLGLDVVGLFTFGAGNAASAGIKAASKGIMSTSKVIKGAERATEIARVTDKTIDAAKTAEKVAEATEVTAKTGKVLETTQDLTKLGEKLLPVYKGLQVTSQVAMFGGLGYGLYEGTKDFVVNLAVPVGKGVAKQVDVATTKTVAV